MQYLRDDKDVIVRLERGEEIVASIERLMDELKIESGSFVGLGATNDVTLGIFHPVDKQYREEHYTEDYEIASLFGTLSRHEGKPYIHAHAVLGDPVAGKMHAGHLKQATISVTSEIHLRITNLKIGRKMDESVGINLMDFEG